MGPPDVISFLADQDLGPPGRGQRLLHTPEVPFQDLPFAAKEGDSPPGAGDGEAEVKEHSEKEIRGHVMFHLFKLRQSLHYPAVSTFKYSMINIIPNTKPVIIRAVLTNSIMAELSSDPKRVRAYPRLFGFSGAETSGRL